MANSSKRGLRYAEKLENADQMLVHIAERMAAREILSIEEVAYLANVHGKCNEARSASWNGSAAWVEWQLAGGDSGQRWVERRNEESAALAIATPEVPAPEEHRDEPMEDSPEPTAGSLSAGNYDLYEALEKISEEDGKWPQAGAAGAHYMKKSMFRDMGLACENCVFFNEGGSCDIVEGEIQPEGVCKLWIIPEEKLKMDEPLESIGKEEPKPAPEQPAAQPPAQRSEKPEVDTLAAIAKLKALALGATANGQSR